MLEAEQELSAGFTVEYSSMRFGMFFLAEYMKMISFSAIFAVFFLGGYRGPFVDDVPALGFLYTFLKIFFCLCLMIWIRASLPRFRYDQLMAFGWKTLLPISVLNFVFLAVFIVLEQEGVFDPIIQTIPTNVKLFEDSAENSMFEIAIEIAKGMGTTLKHLFKPPVTIQYPEIKRPVRHRYKGRHELKRYDNGWKNALVVRFVPLRVRQTPFLWKRLRIRMKNVIPLVNAIQARMKLICCAVFSVDIAKMLAPQKRFVLEHNYELSFYDRASAIYTKEYADCGCSCEWSANTASCGTGRI